MHPLFSKASHLTQAIIGAAIEVHRDNGPGLVESIYEWCLTKELELRQLDSLKQKTVTVRHKSFVREEPLRFDLLGDGCVWVEIKSVEVILFIHKAQLPSYLKLLDVPLGLLINFNVARLANGLSRLILPGADALSPADSASSCEMNP